MEAKPQYKTSLVLAEGAYDICGSFSCPTKHGTQQRPFKSSYARVSTMRQPSSSPKPKSSLSLSLKPKKPSPAPNPPPTGSADSLEFVAYPCGDTLCVCNLSTADSEKATREKRFNNDTTCCCINLLTSSGDALELLVGFDNGEVILLDGITMSQLAKFNSGATLNAARVTDVKWLPGSRTQFVAAFSNGVLLVLDSTKEDASSKSVAAAAASSDSPAAQGGQFSVLRPKTQKSNPVSRWHVGKGPINHISFSSDGKLALSCQDGLARILDINQERLLFSFRSQYGGMLASAWSPDNEYLITGGEDDLVVVWSTSDKCPVARCLGHNSWLSSVEFDPKFCVNNAGAQEGAGGGFAGGSNYRFLSVAQDGRLCFWELNESNLQFSRKRVGGGRRTSAASWNEAAARSALSDVSEVRPEDVPFMEPIYNALISQEPLTSLHITPSSIITSTFSGEARLWSRPTGPPSSNTGMTDED
eukprot:Tamp_13167.p1 GENE.Tamp_13167~~Tamp_13167.p1  ORF type:complete len:474 (+),score=60.75 Tamp_13167:98-1519(+)